MPDRSMGFLEIVFFFPRKRRKTNHIQLAIPAKANTNLGHHAGLKSFKIDHICFAVVYGSPPT
jgi:hypothetical protein